MISVYLLLDCFTAGYKKEAAPILTQPHYYKDANR